MYVYRVYDMFGSWEVGAMYEESKLKASHVIASHFTYVTGDARRHTTFVHHVDH